MSYLVSVYIIIIGLSQSIAGRRPLQQQNVIRIQKENKRECENSCSRKFLRQEKI